MTISYLSTVGPQTREHRIASYNKGCRCDDCRRAAREKRREYRARKKAA